MREIRGGVFQGRFHNLLISKNNTFWAPQISLITFQVVCIRVLPVYECCVVRFRYLRDLPTRRTDVGVPTSALARLFSRNWPRRSSIRVVLTAVTVPIRM